MTDIKICIKCGGRLGEKVFEKDFVLAPGCGGYAKAQGEATVSRCERCGTTYAPESLNGDAAGGETEEDVIVRADWYPNGFIIPLSVTHRNGSATFVNSVNRTAMGEYKCTGTDGSEFSLVLCNNKWLLIWEKKSPEVNNPRLKPWA